MRIVLCAILSFFPATIDAQEASQDAVRPRAVVVQSTTLQDVGPWGAAALPVGLAPLPSDLWRNSDPATLGLLLTKVSPDQRFPSLQNLTRRAIFSGGSAPTNDPDISRTRFEAANRFGPAEATARLVFGVPQLASQPSLAAIAIDAGLRVGRIEEACNLIEAVNAPPPGTVWLEARAVCYALNDEAAAANLSVDLAKSRGLTDTWLSRALAAVAGPVTAPPPFRIDSGRAIALSLRSKLKPPLTLRANQDPMALSALVGSPDFLALLEPQERTALVMNGAGRGVVTLDVVAGHPATIDPALSLAPVPAQVTAKMLTAPNLALRALQARLALEEIKTVMATQPGLMTLAEVPILTEAALWSGEGALASSIANLAPAAIDARLNLVLALYDPTKQAGSVQSRIDAAGSDPAQRRQAMRDSVIAWSAGAPTEGGLSLLVQSGLPSAPAGNAGLRAALELASARGAKGEVILLTALALQGVESAAVDPETLIVSVRSLRKVGFGDAARDLARDYLLANYVTLPPARPATRPSLSPTSAATAPRRAAAPVVTPPAAKPPLAPATRQVPALRPTHPAARAPTTAPIARASRPSSALRQPAPTRAPQPMPPSQPRPATKPSWGTP